MTAPINRGTTIRWTPGVDWLLGVAVIHLFLAVVWFFAVSQLSIVAGIVSYGRWLAIARRAETWLLVIENERLVVLGPGRDGSGYRETVDVRGSVWMVDSAVVIPTRCRTLLIRRRTIREDQFAMLRRALLGRSTSRGSGSG